MERPHRQPVQRIGRVEKQYTKTGALLKGDGDQILLPQGWQSEWIKEIRVVPRVERRVQWIRKRS